MSKHPKAYMSWSGGKDSALALYKCRNRFSVDLLVSNLSVDTDRVAVHGVRSELLKRQAGAVGLPLISLNLPRLPAPEEYERSQQKLMHDLSVQGYDHVVFGDIFLEDLRKYREELSERNGFTAVFPLWNREPSKLIDEFLHAGFKACIVCVDGDKLDASYCGRIIDQELLESLPSDVDLCGENGEYHSFVFDGPNFSKPIKYVLGELRDEDLPSPGEDKATSKRFHFVDLLPA